MFCCLLVLGIIPAVFWTRLMAPLSHLNVPVVIGLLVDRLEYVEIGGSADTISTISAAHRR